MENFTPEIQTLLKKKLDIYRRLNELANIERDAIKKIDVKALWKSAEQKKGMAAEILTVRTAILNCLKHARGTCDMDVQSFSLSQVLRIFPAEPGIRASLREIKTAVEHEKNLLAQSLKINRGYVEEYLAVIDDVMSVAVDSSATAQYTPKGSMPGKKAPKRLIHAEV